MAHDIHCYRCGTSLASLSLPFGRADECPKCRSQLHVCRMCERFTTRNPKGCTEEDSPEVRDKRSANFCDYFKPSAHAFDGADQSAEQAARSALDDLFK